MSQVLASLGSVTGLLAGLFVGVVWIHLAPSSRAPRRWMTALLVIYLGASLHVVGRVISWPLRRDFHAFAPGDAPSAPRAIVLLGASARTVHGRAQKIGVLSAGCAARVLEAARVFRLLDGPWIVSSGGPPEGSDMIPESEVMKTALVELGVPPDRILSESESHVTRDEAVITASILRARGISSCVLVTSGVHMRRALATFHHEGLDCAPAVARDPLDSRSPIRSWLPSPEALDFTQEVVHDYIGIAWYRLRGWL